VLIFAIVTSVILIVSLIADRKKTWLGIKKGAMMFINLLPSLLLILALVAVALALLPKEVMEKILGEESGFWGYFSAAVLGSISLIPGFIAYPLSGVLIKNGVSYPVIAVFITTLMMVGVLTLPLERKYFGWKVAIMRNLLSLIGALAIGITIGFLWSVI